MHALLREPALSAHDVFKDQYSQTLRWSAALALVVLVLAVLVMPEYLPTPYRLQQEEIRVVEIELEAPPLEEPPPEQPRVPEIEPVPIDDPGAVDPPDFPPPLLDVPLENPGWTRPAEDPVFEAASEKPRLLRGAVADYPEIARLAGMQGTVMVKVEVEADGTVRRAEILKGVHPLLDRPALAAARKLLFEPGTQRGMPVSCWVAVPFRFYLH